MEAVRVPQLPGAPRYERHRPEATLLYQLVERHYPAFVDALAARGRTLPGYVQEEFAAYLKCGRLEHGFIGSALNLNIHFHLLVLDGAYELTAAGPQFRAVAAPTPAELEALLGRIVGRIAGHLERRGLVVRDAENSYLSTGPARPPRWKACSATPSPAA